MAVARRRRPSRRRVAADWVSDRLLRAGLACALRFPHARRVALAGAVMGRLVAPLAGYTARSRANLAYVFPDMPAAERRRIARAAADNAGRTLIENYATAELLARMAEVVPEGPGLAALDDAASAGRPVILVSGHFGNYEAARAALVTRGFRIGGLYRPMKNAFVNAHYARTMEAFGGPVLAQGRRGTAAFLRRLREGGIMVLLTDQHNHRGAELSFLGRPARTALSAAEMARNCGAELIPFYATRQADGIGFRVELEAPVPHGPAREMMQAVNDSLSARVRATPEQWFWPHRRWKVRR